MRYLPVPAVLLCCLFAAGCGGPDYVSVEHRARIHSVGVTLPHPEKETMYGDRTSGALAIGIGGAVGGLAAAINMAAGESRFSPVTEPHRAAVAAVITAKVNQALARADKKTGRTDATLTAENVRFGVTHVGDQIFNAAVMGKFKLTLANGEKALDVLLMNTSSTHTFRREEAQANSHIYRAALEQAADHLANDIIARIIYGEPED